MFQNSYFQYFIEYPATYLGECQTSVMKLFCERALYRLKAVNSFRKRAPSYKHDTVVNTLLNTSRWLFLDKTFSSVF